MASVGAPAYNGGLGGEAPLKLMGNVHYTSQFLPDFYRAAWNAVAV